MPLKTYSVYTRCELCGVYDRHPYWCDLCGRPKDGSRGPAPEPDPEPPPKARKSRPLNGSNGARTVAKPQVKPVPRPQPKAASLPAPAPKPLFGARIAASVRKQDEMLLQPSLFDALPQRRAEKATKPRPADKTAARPAAPKPARKKSAKPAVKRPAQRSAAEPARPRRAATPKPGPSRRGQSKRALAGRKPKAGPRRSS